MAGPGGEEQEPLGQGLVHATILPARAAYLISAGSRTGFRRAVQEACTRWAGATEPIVPIGRRKAIGGWWKQVVEISGVDGLVNVDVAGDAATAAANELGLPLVGIEQIDHSGITRWSAHPADLPHGPWGGSGNQSLIARVNGDLWEATAAGDLLPQRESEMANTALLTHRPRTVDEIGRGQLTGHTLLDRTLSQFTMHVLRLSSPRRVHREMNHVWWASR